MQMSLAVAATLSILPAAMAADGFRGVVTAGVTHGGDDWQVATASDGKPLQIRGGGRFEVGGGVLWQSAQYPVQASLVANYHVDPRAGANTSAKFTRVPIDAMVYYTGLQTVRFGVGLSYIVAPTARVTIDGRERDVKFKNGNGSAFEIGYRIAPDVWTSLRLSSAKFKPKAAGSAQGAQEADVSHLSVNVAYVF